LETLIAVCSPAWASTCSAAACGVRFSGRCVAMLSGRSAPSGSLTRVAVLLPLSQYHDWSPLMIRLVSASCVGIATRILSCPPYQTFTSCDPDSRLSGELPPACGSAGRPSDAVCWTVPDIGGGPSDLSVAAAASASNCWAERSGSTGSPLTAAMTGPAPSAPPITATATIGTPHLMNVPLRISLLNGMSIRAACVMHP
jgi:hypothetical protein